MSYIYVSEPFSVKEGLEVEIPPIEVSQNNKKNDETRGILLKNNSPAANYILKIFKVTKAERETFVGFTFTDSFGQFIIPLSSKNAKYIIKVYSLKEETEDLELIIK